MLLAGKGTLGRVGQEGETRDFIWNPRESECSPGGSSVSHPTMLSTAGWMALHLTRIEFMLFSGGALSLPRE